MSEILSERDLLFALTKGVGGYRFDLMLAILHATKEQPISTRLCCGYGNTDERGVRAVVEKMRRAGFLVCVVPGTGGYYMPRTVEEKREGIRHFYGSALTQIRNVRTMLAASGNVELAGQLRLEIEAAMEGEQNGQ